MPLISYRTIVPIRGESGGSLPISLLRFPHTVQCTRAGRPGIVAKIPPWRRRSQFGLGIGGSAAPPSNL
jgi:hypothetical protein